MLRLIATAGILGLLVAMGVACGGSDVPHGVPAVEKDAGPYVDAGPDAGPLDAGEWFVASCADAGCSDLDHCEPLDGGTVACGPLCGEACSDARCAPGECDDPDGGGWGPAVCTNAPLPKHWSKAPACDDGNDCTSGDTCVSGSCLASAAPTTQSCSTGSPCTHNDHCDGQGSCTAGAKITANPIDRFLGPPFGNYIYGPPGWGTNFGYTQQGTIFQSISSGDRPIHELHDNGTDRLLSKDTSEGSYANDTTLGFAMTGFSSQLPGTVPLLRYKYPAGSGHCTNGADVDCHLFTTDASEKPSGSTGEATNIFVCPP